MGKIGEATQHPVVVGLGAFYLIPGS